MSEENSTKHKIELTIRCALQTFNDRTIECPLDWTVLQLKQHLYKICSSKPEISRQRLIYAGHCLDNDQRIGSVLRRDENGGDSCSEAPQVIHLVCVNKEMLSASSTSSSRTANSNELRQRHNVANTVPLPNNNVPLNPQQFQYMPNSPEAYQNYLNQMAIQQQQQMLGAYNPNLYYNPYDQQQHAHFLNSMMMASVMGVGWPQQQQLMPFGGGYGFQPAQPFMFAGGPPTGGVLMGGPAGDALLPFQPNNNQFQQQQVVNAPAPVVNNNNNNNDEQQPDFLALIYKSIRFALLMMVLYLYSSIERFFAAIFLIGLVWFVQQRRHQNRVEQPPAPIITPPTEAPNDNNNNNANIPNQEAAMGSDNLALSPPSNNNNNNNRPPQSVSAWSVFWSTVTSFFASLIPENPQVPVNIN